jgi:LmbE family N-acetylglucosaminyl deacetylase
VNILAIGAHFDDVELGCGGALARHVRQGDNVYVYVATVSGYANYQQEVMRSNDVALGEARNAMAILGVKELICGQFKTLELEFVDALNIEILRILEEKRIGQVFTHWVGDTHHDHQAVAKSTIHCCRYIPRVLMYRSNWYDSPCTFRGNFYIDISATWEVKEQAIRAYVSEMQRVGDKWLRFFRNEAENAGLHIGVKYAETFDVIKWLEE